MSNMVSYVPYCKNCENDSKIVVGLKLFKVGKEDVWNM